MHTYTKGLVVNYEFVDHGVEHPDYFQGCGVAFTKYDYCFTGTSSVSPYEAASDALDQSHEMVKWNDAVFEECEEELKQFLKPFDKLPEDSEALFYVSVRVRMIT